MSQSKTPAIVASSVVSRLSAGTVTISGCAAILHAAAHPGRVFDPVDAVLIVLLPFAFLGATYGVIFGRGSILDHRQILGALAAARWRASEKISSLVVNGNRMIRFRVLRVGNMTGGDCPHLANITSRDERQASCGRPILGPPDIRDASERYVWGG